MSLERFTNGQLPIRLEEGWFLPLVVRRRRLDKFFRHLNRLLANSRISTCFQWTDGNSVPLYVFTMQQLE